ncbi:MAG: hypothetical protein IH611_05030 [Deltaproteobacteria bacterium]|nr:hypothetical protein [Deltaproteobacteria bacterium]
MTVQNLTFVDGNSRNESEHDGGGAIRVFSQYQALPVYVVNSTFGGVEGYGNTMTLALYGTRIENNQVNMHGSAIFFITNDRTGTLHIEDSVIRQNSGGYWYELPEISMHSDTNRQIVNSTIE